MESKIGLGFLALLLKLTQFTTTCIVLKFFTISSLNIASEICDSACKVRIPSPADLALGERETAVHIDIVEFARVREASQKWSVLLRPNPHRMRM